MTLELVAMAQAGDFYISRDDSQRLWRHTRYLPGDPLQISPIEAERAIDTYGCRRIAESFASWRDLSARVEQLVPRVQILPEDLPVSPRLARALLPVLRERVTDPATAPVVPRVVARLLQDPSVKSDDRLQSELVQLLMSATSFPSIPVTRVQTTPRAESRVGTVFSYFDDSIGAAA